MPIDSDQLSRDLQACIADKPVLMRFPKRTGTSFEVDFHDLSASLAILEPGVDEVKNASAVALKSSFLNGIPEDEDDVEIQKPGGGWTTYTCKGVMGGDDPSLGEVVIMLEAEK